MDSVKPVFTTFDNTPHFLMELSQEEHLLLKNSIIHLAGLSVKTCNIGNQKTVHTTFESVVFGKNVKIMKDGTISKIALSQMKRRMVMVTMDKVEFNKSMQNVCIVNTRFDLKQKSKMKKLFKPSGIIILMIASEKKRLLKMMSKIRCSGEDSSLR